MEYEEASGKRFTNKNRNSHLHTEWVNTMQEAKVVQLNSDLNESVEGSAAQSTMTLLGKICDLVVAIEDDKIRSVLRTSWLTACEMALRDESVT